MNVSTQAHARNNEPDIAPASPDDFEIIAAAVIDHAKAASKGACTQLCCPAPLRDLKGWLIWRYEPNDNPGGKPRKMPHYAGGGRRHGKQGTPEDRRQLVTFEQAVAAAKRRRFDGVGFAPQADFGIVALDFDDAIVDGKILPEISELLAGTYAELSPSGKGVRAFYRGQLGDLKSHKRAHLEYGIELFSSKGFVTVTGRVLPMVQALGDEDTVAPVDARLQAFIQRRFKHELEQRAEAANYESQPLGLTPGQIAQALEALPKELDYDAWLNVGMALHHEFNGSGEGFELWDRWSSESPKYTTRDYGLARWNSFGRGQHSHVVTARSLVHLANEHGAGIDLIAPASAEDFESLIEVARAQQPRYEFEPIGDFAGGPAPEWIVKDVVPQAQLVVMFGESTAGKTFVALDLVAAIARGTPWRGKRVKQGAVAYVAAEGAGGFRKRCKAYGIHHNIDLANLPLHVLAAAPNLLQRDDVTHLTAALGRIGPVSVVVIDTFAQTTPGANENAAEDVGKALAHCRRIHEATGAVVLLVHHAGKDSSKGARGWSGLKAAADAEIEISRDGDQRAIRISKQKDGEDNAQWGFALEPVVISLDEDGEAVTSCVVVECEPPTSRRIGRALGQVEAVVNEVVQQLAAQAPNGGFEVKEVLDRAVQLLPEPQEGKEDRRRDKARTALNSLAKQSNGHLGIDQGLIRIL